MNKGKSSALSIRKFACPIAIVLIASSCSDAIGQGKGQSNQAASDEYKWNQYLAAASKDVGDKDYAAAEKDYALAIKEAEKFGPNDRRIAFSLMQLAGYRVSQKKFTEAGELLQRALRMSEKSDDQLTTITVLHSLSSLYSNQKKYKESESVCKRVLDIYQKSNDQRGTASEMIELASLYREQNRISEAESLYKAALAIEEKAGPLTRQNDSALGLLAGCYWKQKRYDQAEPLLQSELAIDTKEANLSVPFSKKTHDYPRQMIANAVALDMNTLALFYAEQGRYAQAEPLFKQSIALFEQVQFPKNHYIITLLKNYASMLRKAGRPKEAVPLEAKAKEEEKKAENDK